MPELPEVETVRIALNEHLLKCKISKVRINVKNLRFPVPNNLEKSLEGKVFEKINRRGKYLLINFKQDLSLLVHLGMTGVFKINNSYNPEKHDHIVIELKEKFLIYNDVRRFGFFKVYKKNLVMQSPHLKKLGPEPLDIGFNELILKKKMMNKTQNIKHFLMDQKNIAGLGNIYCSEILFDSKISPLRLVNDMKKSEIKKIVKSIKKILTKAIELGGTSLSDYKTPSGKLGYFKNELKVYGMENKNCFFCKKRSKIKKLVQQGRSTFFCMKCQK